MFAETPARALLVVRLFAGCILLTILVVSSSVTASDSLPSCVTLEFGEDLPEGLDFSPDGKLVAGRGGMIPTVTHVWNVSDGELVAEMSYSSFALSGFGGYVAFSPDGGLVVLPTLLEIELWSMRGGKRRRAIPLFADPADFPRDGGMSSLPHLPWPIPLFSRDGKTLVAVRSDRQVFVIDVAAAKTRQILKDFPNAFLAMHADSNRVVGCASRESRLKIALYNLETGKTETVLDRQVPSKKTVTEAALSQDGRFLATLERDEAWSDYVIHVWETLTGKQLTELKKPTARGRSRVHQDTRPTARMLSTRPSSRFKVDVLQGAGASHESGMKAEFVLSPDNRRLAVMGEDHVDLWDIRATVPSVSDTSSSEEPVQEAEARTWTSADGRYSVEAQLVDVVGGVAVLRRMGGIEVNVPLEKLSKKDLEYIAQRNPHTLDSSEKKDP